MTCHFGRVSDNAARWCPKQHSITTILTQSTTVEACWTLVTRPLVPAGLVGAGRAAGLVGAASQTEVAGAAGQVCRGARVLPARAIVAPVTRAGRAGQPGAITVEAGHARLTVTDSRVTQAVCARCEMGY